MANTKVQSEQIEDGSITADKIADGAIVATELADNAVTTAKINADAVTGAKIADDAINSEHYTDGSIDTAHIADDQVTQAKMANDSVGADELASNAVVTASIVDANVTTAKIADGNISTAKLADNAVTSAKIDTNIAIAGDLTVQGGQINTGNTSGDHSEFGTDGSGHTFIDASTSGGNLFLQAGGSTKVTMNSTGLLGIGTTSPSQTLETVGNIFINAPSGNPDLTIKTAGTGNNPFVAYRAGDNVVFDNMLVASASTDYWRVGYGASGSVASEWLAVTAEGKVGIRDTTPDAILKVNSSGGGSELAFKVADASDNSVFEVQGGGTAVFQYGRVGIGITTPSDNSTGALYVKGNEHVVSIRNQSTTNAGERVSIDFLDHNGTRRGYISVDTSGTLFSTSSDYRLKNVIEPVENGIERINKLNPVKFAWIETGKEEEGFIAHEVDEIFNDAVGGEKDAIKEDGSIDAQTMDYGRITPLLVKAIQEQQTIIDDLKARIEALES